MKQARSRRSDEEAFAVLEAMLTESRINGSRPRSAA
jgi:hypothetical protein